MPQVGDIGTAIDYDAGESIADATLLKLKYLKPNGVNGEWVATLFGTQVARFITTLVTDLPASGWYQLQLYMESPTWKGHGTIVSFYTKLNLG